MTFPSASAVVALPAKALAFSFQILHNSIVLLASDVVDIILGEGKADFVLLDYGEGILDGDGLFTLGRLMGTELRLGSRTLLPFLRMELLRADDAPLARFF